MGKSYSNAVLAIIETINCVTANELGGGGPHITRPFDSSGTSMGERSMIVL